MSLAAAPGAHQTAEQGGTGGRTQQSLTPRMGGEGSLVGCPALDCVIAQQRQGWPEAAVGPQLRTGARLNRPGGTGQMPSLIQRTGMEADGGFLVDTVPRGRRHTQTDTGPRSAPIFHPTYQVPLAQPLPAPAVRAFLLVTSVSSLPTTPKRSLQDRVPQHSPVLRRSPTSQTAGGLSASLAPLRDWSHQSSPCPVGLLHRPGDLCTFGCLLPTRAGGPGGGQVGQGRGLWSQKALDHREGPEQRGGVMIRVWGPG